MNNIDKIDHMKYLPSMENIGSEILDKVINKRNSFNDENFTRNDVFKALSHKNRDEKDFAILLSSAASECLEEIAQVSQKETREHFGLNINVFTPLYISNYCDNNCVYCGFNVNNKIHRAKLSDEEIENELLAIKKTNLEELLILTGESHVDSDIKYIGNACKIAKKYFKVIGVEVYPLNSNDYKYLHECGVDYVTVFQETYNDIKYSKVHLAGYKRIFPYRFNAQERALIGGMRGVAFGALLGLDDYKKDAYATGLHAYYIQKKYPYAEIAISCPRLRPIINNAKINPRDVHERELLQIIMAYRLFLPFASITISTRERASFRDNIIKIAANKISAGVSVGIGGHSDKKGDEQFEINDNRSVDEVCEAIKKQGLNPLMSEYIYV